MSTAALQAQISALQAGASSLPNTNSPTPTALPVFASRAALTAGNVGTASLVTVQRFNADGPIANIVYEVLSAAPTGRDAITSLTISGTDANGHPVTKYTRLAVNVPTPEMFGAYGDAAPMGLAYNDATYTAGKATEHDDTTALQNHLNYLNDGDTWFSGGQGRHYAVSATLKLNARRTVIDFGVLVPFGNFSDYLLNIAQGSQGPDPTANNVSINVQIKRLRIVGRWQSRGLHLNDVYMSHLAGVYITHCSGTAIKCDDCYENQWFGTTLALNANRTAVDVSGATVWATASAYAVGAIVTPTYNAWASATAYNINDLVLYSGGVYRSLIGGNTGNAPSSTGAAWVRDEFEYYQCQIAQAANAGTNPMSASPDYTTASGVSAQNIWKRVLVNEPLIDLTNTTASVVVDHEYFWGLDVRDNACLEFFRVDEGGSNRPEYAIELYGCHFEGMTPGVPYAAAGSPTAPASGTANLNGPLGSYPGCPAGTSNAAISTQMDTNARANATYLRFSRASRCKLIGTTIRIGGQGSTAVKLGGQHPNDLVSELHMQNVDINGEDGFLIGVYTGVSVQDVKQAIGSINLALTAATSLEIVDPAARLNNSSIVVPQRFADGSPSRPALASRNDVATGISRRGPGVWAFSSAGTPTISFGPSPALSDSSDRAATTAFVKNIVPTLSWAQANVAVTAGTGTFTTVAGVVNYQTTGKALDFSTTVTITTVGTASGTIYVALPAGVNSAAYRQIVPGLSSGNVALIGIIEASSTSVTILRFDGAALALASGTSLIVGGRIQTA